ncbi:DUF2378 family protein [Hyalangium minutum]|uniref:TIGR02265 family protein n=1 Tax=Hyalangium minutum TaxID=394096 RepID=A0A085WW85_9BACT|nr:DUF2378 family protein [Hyalangium minutum]KFE71948.1 hypothetical protein DB31_0209 [Hyalangium minutum]
MSGPTATPPPLSTIQDPRKQLEQRLALAGPQDTCRGIFFNGVLDAVRALAGAEIEARCREAAGQRRFIDFFSYPVSGFIKMSLTVVELLTPRLGGSWQVLRWMGEQSTESFVNTVAGKTALALAGTNVKKLISHLPTSYKASLSYGERTVTWTGERSGVFIFKRDFMPPAYHEGVIAKAVEKATARNVQVRGRDTSALDTEYVLTWDEGPGL